MGQRDRAGHRRCPGEASQAATVPVPEETPPAARGRAGAGAVEDRPVPVLAGPAPAGGAVQATPEVATNDVPAESAVGVDAAGRITTLRQQLTHLQAWNSRLDEAWQVFDLELSGHVRAHEQASGQGGVLGHEGWQLFLLNLEVVTKDRDQARRVGALNRLFEQARATMIPPPPGFLLERATCISIALTELRASLGQLAEEIAMLRPEVAQLEPSEQG